MESKIIFVTILHICLGQWKSCINDQERQSKEEIQQCFSDNASLNPCIDHECNTNSLCNSNNIDEDVACLINACQKACKSKEKSCVTNCLNLKSCNERDTKEEYMDCIRKSTENQLKICFNGNEEHSKEEIKECFSAKVSLDPCINYDCNEAGDCKSNNLNDDLACLINSCQKQCQFKLESCYIKCLSLDYCSNKNTGEEYMDCIRKSAADYCEPFDLDCIKSKCRANGKSEDECLKGVSSIPDNLKPYFKSTTYNPYRDRPKDPPRDSRTTADPFEEVTKKKDSDWWAISIIIITVIVILLVLAWPMFTAFRMSNRGNASSHTPVIDPQNIPKGAYPVQNMPMAVSAQGSQQSLGQGMTPYPVENQLESKSQSTKRLKLPELPEQKRMKSKL